VIDNTLCGYAQLCANVKKIKKVGYRLPVKGFGEIKIFSPKLLPSKVFGHLMISLTFRSEQATD
jgi:hypothetical protein